MSRETQNFHIFPKTSNDVVQLRNGINSGTFLFFKIWFAYSSQNVISCMDFSDVNFQ